MSSILKPNELRIFKFTLEHFGPDILNELGINNMVEIFPEVKGIIEDGDLDVVIIDPSVSHETIVLECKRIKIKIEEDQSEKVNKLGDLKKLVSQVNNRIKRGFHKVYLTVLIVCDGRNKIANNILFNHANSKTLESIYTHSYLNNLDSKAGILFLEPSQLTAKDYNPQASCGIYQMRKPIPQNQPVELTKKLQVLLV